jgi:hypothetical protein
MSPATELILLIRSYIHIEYLLQEFESAQAYQIYQIVLLLLCLLSGRLPASQSNLDSGFVKGDRGSHENADDERLLPLLIRTGWSQRVDAVNILNPTAAVKLLGSCDRGDH